MEEENKKGTSAAVCGYQIERTNHRPSGQCQNTKLDFQCSDQIDIYICAYQLAI